MRYGSVIPPVFALTFFMATSATAGCLNESLPFAPETDASALSGNAILATSPSTIDPTTGQLETWKEDHCGNGDLYKLGSSTPVDPRAYRGTWTDNGDGTVTYNYGSEATTYTWKLYAYRKGPFVSALCWEDTAANPPTTIATGSIITTGSCP